jgi:hypothetical protein
MRYLQLAASAGLFLFLAAGAVPGQAQKKEPMEIHSDYYPLGAGYQWSYRATVNEPPPQKEQTVKDSRPIVTITAGKPEVFDHKFTVEKKEYSEPAVGYRLKVVSGPKESLKQMFEQVAVLKDGVYRISTAGKDITPPLRFLKLPVKGGESWTVSATSENVMLAGTFTCDVEAVKVPLGNFETLHVSSPDFQLGNEKMALDYWFAKDLGMVKQRVRVGKSNVVLELEAFNKPGK